ncbi:bifunctional demethylmenaquinone methyltransferase/2-methoxy-6-polyprenyl-1,4-benzoquinol methylase UbiE [Lactobacillaceae bacterium L1_55_11]|nr:bifunctional demethylmenaquinone methyltransferase/2-methoxy-6-polyprenyl-1,4-benzoquinol methylase UbiE [Lactobacillaceae bacterium L1_55_11]
MVRSPKNTNVAGLFDHIAPEYDKMNNIISLGNHQHWRRQVMAQIQLPAAGHFLDVATGTADWALALAQASDAKSQVVGLDFSAQMLAVGQKKVAASPVADKIQLVQGDAMHLPFEDQSFDLVTIGFGLRNLPDPKQGLIEMYRVLKSGGQLVILETSQPTNPIIKPFWRFYVGKLMPWFGQVFAHGKGSAYQYLDETTEHFMNYQALSQLLADLGYQDVTVKRFSFGAAAAHFARKPD